MRRRLPPLVGILLVLLGAVAEADEDSFLDVPFSWGIVVPGEVQDALAAYEDGRLLEVLSRVEGIYRSNRLERAHDDARMLHALALLGLGRDEQAAGVLRPLLEERPPSPYYPLALLELVEIHHRANRPEEVTREYARYFDPPWRGDDEESRLIRTLLFEYGTLRSGEVKLSPSEKQRLANTEELEVRLEKRMERPTDRLLYLSGTALLRTREYARSLHALRRIGIESPYYPYALYAMALDQIALHNEADDSGIVDRLTSFEVDDSAIAILQRLLRYPEMSPHETALDSRARLLLVRLAFRAGEIDKGVRIATSLPEGDPHAEEGRLLVAGELLGQGDPALALVHAGETEEEDSAEASPDGDLRSADVVVHRGLILGRAYTELGDPEGAVRTYRAALQRMKRDSLEGSTDHAAGRLRALAGVLVKQEAAREARLRRHRARGIQQVLAYEGWGPWWNPGRVRRTLESTLGARSHGVLARGYEPEIPLPVATDRAWLDFLRSPERDTVTTILARLLDLESRPDSGAAALADDSADAATVARTEMSELLQDGADREIRNFLQKRERTHRALELQLEKSLSRALNQATGG